MKKSNPLNRRSFLTTAAGTTLGLSLADTKTTNAQNETTPATPTDRLGIGTNQRTGEPYELLGKRMVFTNWYYVRPGDFGYFDADGKKIALQGNATLFGAQMKEFDAPAGIKLHAMPAQHEKAPFSIRTIIQQGNKIMAWGDKYRETTDGTNWIETPINGPVGTTVFIDPTTNKQKYKSAHLTDATEQQFQAFQKLRPNEYQRLSLDADPGRVHAVFACVSDDGINWKQLPVPISVEHSDTNITICYDTILKKYVMYARNYPLGPRSTKVPYDDFRDQWAVAPRAIGRSVTDDFNRFPASEVILEPTPSMAPTDMLYTSGYTTIPHAPDHHLMFATVWHKNTDTTSIALLSSHNGTLWNYLPDSPVFETPPFGQWDGGCVFTNVNLVELPDGRYVLPYTGFNVPHKYPRNIRTSDTGWLYWPKGRLIALEAEENGHFTTVAFVPPGKTLRINAQTHRVGKIQIEAVDYLSGKPIDGRSFADSIPIVGDKHWDPVTWKNHNTIGHKQNSAIMLRFKMEKAKIFGLEFA